MKGKVYLIGSGPGDIGLITVKALDLLTKGDVIIYDYLSNPGLLQYARPEAELICGDELGKRRYPNGSVVAQKLINQLIVKKAKAGKVVVRLKGGDPFVFGRGGEEAEVLVKNRIPFEVVPGVTAANGLAYAGFPLTHRQYASSVSLITGHEDPTKPGSSVDWENISRVGTLVFYMGVGNLPKIVERLISHGRDRNTAAAVIEKVTSGRQRAIIGTLKDIVGKAARAKVSPPALIVVGNVIKLRRQLNWFEKKPLFGRRVLVTRTREQASQLSEKLRELGAEVIEFPTIKIVPLNDYSVLDEAIDLIQDYHWVIFTSVNGVEYFFSRLAAAGKDARHLSGVKFCAIGPATAERLICYGVSADYQPAEYRAEGILANFPGTVAGRRILIPRAEKAREILPEQLTKKGARVDVVPAYRTVTPEGDLKQLKDIDIATFTSSSTVENFVKMAGRRALKGAKLVSIGPITTATARQLGLRIDIEAKEYTIDGLVNAIIRRIAK